MAMVNITFKRVNLNLTSTEAPVVGDDSTSHDQRDSTKTYDLDVSVNKTTENNKLKQQDSFTITKSPSVQTVSVTAPRYGQYTLYTKASNGQDSIDFIRYNVGGTTKIEYKGTETTPAKEKTYTANEGETVEIAFEEVADPDEQFDYYIELTEAIELDATLTTS